jgi:hypothetical protein
MPMGLPPRQQRPLTPGPVQEQPQLPGGAPVPAPGPLTDTGGGGRQIPGGRQRPPQRQPPRRGGGPPPAPKPRVPNPATDPLPQRYRQMMQQNPGMTEQQVRQRWAQHQAGQLPGQNGQKPLNPGGPPVPGGPAYKPPGGGGGKPGGGSVQLPPIGGGPPGGGGGGGGPFQFQPGGPIMGGPSGNPMPGAFNDPFNSLLAAIPMMDLNAKRQTSQAMSEAGFTGNRWSSGAMDTAGRIGAENALAQNKMMLDALYGTANQAEDRALQATGMATNLGGLMNQIDQSRVTLPFQLGQYEQGRQDHFSNQAYEDFERNKLGWLPWLSQMASGQHGGTPGQIYQTQTPGKPGALDYAGLLAGLFG